MEREQWQSHQRISSEGSLSRGCDEDTVWLQDILQLARSEVRQAERLEVQGMQMVTGGCVLGVHEPRQLLDQENQACLGVGLQRDILFYVKLELERRAQMRDAVVKNAHTSSRLHDVAHSIPSYLVECEEADRGSAINLVRAQLSEEVKGSGASGEQASRLARQLQEAQSEVQSMLTAQADVARAIRAFAEIGKEMAGMNNPELVQCINATSTECDSATGMHAEIREVQLLSLKRELARRPKGRGVSVMALPRTNTVDADNETVEERMGPTLSAPADGGFRQVRLARTLQDKRHAKTISFEDIDVKKKHISAKQRLLRLSETQSSGGRIPSQQLANAEAATCQLSRVASLALKRTQNRSFLRDDDIEEFVKQSEMNIDILGEGVAGDEANVSLAEIERALISHWKMELERRSTVRLLEEKHSLLYARLENQNEKVKTEEEISVASKKAQERIRNCAVAVSNMVANLERFSDQMLMEMSKQVDRTLQNQLLLACSNCGTSWSGETVDLINEASRVLGCRQCRMLRQEGEAANITCTHIYRSEATHLAKELGRREAGRQLNRDLEMEELQKREVVESLHSAHESLEAKNIVFSEIAQSAADAQKLAKTYVLMSDSNLQDVIKQLRVRLDSKMSDACSRVTADYARAEVLYLRRELERRATQKDLATQVEQSAALCGTLRLAEEDFAEKEQAIEWSLRVERREVAEARSTTEMVVAETAEKVEYLEQRRAAASKKVELWEEQTEQAHARQRATLATRFADLRKLATEEESQVQMLSDELVYTERRRQQLSATLKLQLKGAKIAMDSDLARTRLESICCTLRVELSACRQEFENALEAEATTERCHQKTVQTSESQCAELRGEVHALKEEQASMGAEANRMRLKQLVSSQALIEDARAEVRHLCESIWDAYGAQADFQNSSLCANVRDILMRTPASPLGRLSPRPGTRLNRAPLCPLAVGPKHLDRAGKCRPQSVVGMARVA